MLLSCFRQHMLDYKKLLKIVQNMGFPAFRAKQVAKGIYGECREQFSDIKVLPEELKAKLDSQLRVLSLKPVKNTTSKDRDTIKVLFETIDGHKIESVLMRYSGGRNTVCVSCQVGCRLGCKFCSTGKLGFFRDLEAEEISDQVLYFKQLLNKNPITNIVFMGMGEPFMNYDNVMEAIHNLNDKETFGIGARNMTISTAGIPEGISRLANEGLQINLAISLHAPDQELRGKIMPIARKYSLDELFRAIDEYVRKTNRRVSYEYIMLKNINDSEENAAKLAALMKDRLCHINLIPYNTSDSDGFKKSTTGAMRRFLDILKHKGVPVTVRKSLGDDIRAACGQLANKT